MCCSPKLSYPIYYADIDVFAQRPHVTGDSHVYEPLAEHRPRYGVFAVGLFLQQLVKLHQFDFLHGFGHWSILPEGYMISMI